MDFLLLAQVGTKIAEVVTDTPPLGSLWHAFANSLVGLTGLILGVLMWLDRRRERKDNHRATADLARSEQEAKAEDSRRKDTYARLGALEKQYAEIMTLYQSKAAELEEVRKAKHEAAQEHHRETLGYEQRIADVRVGMENRLGTAQTEHVRKIQEVCDSLATLKEWYDKLEKEHAELKQEHDRLRRDYVRLLDKEGSID